MGYAAQGRPPGQVKLDTEAKQWGTPNAHPRTFDQREVDHGEQIANQAHNWQAPTAAAEAPNMGSNIKRGPKSLLAQAQWATPVASDDGRKVTSASLQPGLIGEAAEFAGRLDPETTGRLSLNAYGRPRLNPTFVEGLQGWPIGWTSLVVTDCESWATASCLSRPPTHGDSSGRP